jgi:hypothetical protein
MAAFMLLQSSILGADPGKDYAAWLREWWANMPRNYSLEYEEVFNRKKPLKMTFEYFGDSDHRLCVTSDSRMPTKEYRVFLNPEYAASIESSNLSEPVWHVKEFASRRSDNFSTLETSLDTAAEFLGSPTMFDHPNSFEVSESVVDQDMTRQIVYTFEKHSMSKARDPSQLIATLDQSMGWVPREIKKTEFGGITSRVQIGGWYQRGDHSLFRNVTTFVQMPGSEKEVLHSKQEWEFSQSDARRRAECYLDFYDLPEPSGSDGPWRVLVFVCAVVLSAIGYLLIRRSV